MEIKMEAPLPNFLSVLPLDMLRLINDRIPCLVHRRRLALVCRSFRDAIHPQHQPATPVLPWILLSRPGWPSFSCVLRGCGTHDDLDVPADARAARYFGAYERGWVFLAIGQTDGHTLLNLRTHQRFELPDVLRLRFMPCPCDAYDMSLIMLAATLSSPPEQGHSIVAAICCTLVGGVVTAPRVRAFWRLGHVVPVKFDTPGDFDGPCLEDVLHHDRVFYFLTDNENLLMFAPVEHEDDKFEIQPRGTRYFQQEGRHYDGDAHARYLVESRGQLLMVVRLAPHLGQPTSSFRVFQMVQAQVPMPIDDYGEYHIAEYTWNELDALGGRMLFVGRGCSRSHEVANYPGFNNGIYFLDDERFYGETTMFEDPSTRQYPCRDSGKWLSSEPIPRIENFLPVQSPSIYSAPSWFLN